MGNNMRGKEGRRRLDRWMVIQMKDEGDAK